MENNHENQQPEQNNPAPEEDYVPRPLWQVWGARIGLVIFIIFVILQLLQIAGGGL